MQSPPRESSENHASATIKGVRARVIIFKESSRCFEIQCTPSLFIKVFAPDATNSAEHAE
jgi:hypothetical protein